MRSLSIWADLVKAPGCWKPFGTTFAQLFCFARNHRRAYIPPSGRDHVEPFIAYNTTDAQMGDELPLLGYADDNWVDGRQSYVYAFDYPDAWNAGFGFTTTLTHEVGHHLGMSHPHDGYDASSVVDFAPVGKTYDSWVGDESNTVMSYNAVSNVFGVFDKDNMSRYQTAGYLIGRCTARRDRQGVVDSARSDPTRCRGRRRHRGSRAVPLVALPVGGRRRVPGMGPGRDGRAAPGRRRASAAVLQECA